MGERTLSPEQFAGWPAQLGPDDFAVMQRALNEEHGSRGLPEVSNASLRRAAGFVVAGQLTAVTELFKGDDGVMLPNIHKPGANDPAIATAVDHLRDRYKRTVTLAVLSTANSVIHTAPVTIPAATYRASISGIARAHGPVDPVENPLAFAAKQAELSTQRAEIASVVGDAVLEGLHVAELGGQFHLSDHQLTVVAHNLTRWEPAPEWFAPPA